MSLDPLEDPRAAEPGEAQLVAQPAGDAVADRAAREELRACDRRRTAQARSSTPASCGRVGSESSCSLAPARACTSRGHIQPPARQSRPKSCQKFVSWSAVHSASDDRSSASSRYAGDAQHESSDRIRRSAAVVEHVGPRGVAGRHGILTERAQQIVEQRDRQIERSNRMRERDDNQILVRDRGGRSEPAGRRPRRAGGPATRRSRASRSAAGAVPSSAMSSAMRAKAYTAATCGRIGAGSSRDATGKFS